MSYFSKVLELIETHNPVPDEFKNKQKQQVTVSERQVIIESKPKIK
jgi:hypothetical protein